MACFEIHGSVTYWDLSRSPLSSSLDGVVQVAAFLGSQVLNSSAVDKTYHQESGMAK